MEHLSPHTPDASLIIDRVGIVRYASASACRLMGRLVPELLNQPFQHPVAPGLSMLTVRHPGGQVVFLQMQVIEIDWDEHPAYQVVLSDITAREQEQRSLRESEERWQFALEGSGAGVWDLDLRTGQTYRSPQWKEMFGYGDSGIDLASSEWEKRIHPDDYQRVMEEMGRYLRDETTQFTSEYRLRCKDGAYKWVLDRGCIMQWSKDGRPLRMVGTVIDITQRRQIEEELLDHRRRLEEMVHERTAELRKANTQLRREMRERERATDSLRVSEERLHTIVANAPILLWAVNREGVFTFAEGKHSLIFGFQPEEIIDKSAFELFRNMPQLQQDFHRALAGEAFTSEARVHSTFYETHYSPLFDESGRVTSVIGVSTDIAERKWIEDKLRHSHDDLEKQVEQRAAELLGVNQQLRTEIAERRQIEEALRRSAEQKTLLLREIHHRVKNNLSIVISLINMQQRQANPELLDILKEIELRIRSMALIHEQLYRSVDIDRIPFASYLSSLAATVSSSLGQAKICLHTNIASANLDIETALACGLIANELLTNAYKHAFPPDQEGDIYLEFLPDEEKSAFSHGDSSPKSGGSNRYLLRQASSTQPALSERIDYWRLTVSDNGAGLQDMAVLDGKTSLGLHIVRLLTKQLKADLMINNEHGVKFILVFPERSKPVG